MPRSDPTNSARQARLRERRKRTGIEPVHVYIPRRWTGLIQNLAEVLREMPRLPATEFLVYWRDPQGRVHPLRELTRI